MTDLLTTDATRVSARRAQTRERLMAAAVDVFAQRGVIGASVEEISEAAGFTRGAFYSNFGDKDELVLALIQNDLQLAYAAAERAIAAMREASAAGRTPEELVAIALGTFEESSRSGRQGLLTRQELLLYAARQPQVRDAYVAFSDACLSQFSTLIADAVAFSGLEFTVDFADAIALLTAAHDQAHVQSLFSGSAPDLRPLRVLVLAITRPAA